MSRLSQFFPLAVVACATVICFPLNALQSQTVPNVGPNVNMVSGKEWPGGDPNLQRQNEPSIAVSTRNPMHLLAGANDYRTVDLAGLMFPEEDTVTPDAWLGVFKSFDNGMTWRSTLLPGCPYDLKNPKSVCWGSPPSPLIGRGFTAGADPTVRAGVHGMFFYSFIAFDRNQTENGALAVASFIDDNNKEAGDPIRYLGTSIVDTNTGGQFADKPSLAVDRPRPGCGSCTDGKGHTYPTGNIYVAYTIFLGRGQNVHTKLMVAVSNDCAKTWRLQKVSEGDHVNQGAIFAIDPDTGAVYLAWRRFQTKSQTDTIMVAKSVDQGRSFSKSMEVVPSILPFDQKTSQSAVAFRTNTYPTMAAIGGRVYLAWADRVTGPQADARIVLYSSANGSVWNAHGMVDDTVRGHQIMPALTAAGGKLMLIYYDLREDHTYGKLDPIFVNGKDANLYTESRVPTGNLALGQPNLVFTPWIMDGTLGLIRRHTIDVRAVQITPTAAGPADFASSRVSQYMFGQRTGEPKPPKLIEQLQFNPPNLKIFRKGTVPFFGDYIDVGALAYVPDANGWTSNTAPSNSTVFHATWTDNRNVRPGDVNKYAPPNSQGGKSLFDPTQTKPTCVPGQSKSGVMNQDIYTARITEGLVVGTLGNAKPLSISLKRAFSFFVQNTKTECKSYLLTIENQPPGGVASFKQFGTALTTLKVTIGPKSGIARSIFVTSSNPKASVTVKAREIEVTEGSNPCSPGTLPDLPKTGGLQGTVVLNPDTTNPEIENPEIENPLPIATAEVYNPEIENPEIENPEIENPEIENPEIENPEIENRRVANAGIANPEIENPEIENPEIENPEIENPEIENIPPDKGQITDVSWKVTNKGNTSATYNAKLLAKNPPPSPIKLQLVVHRLYTTNVAKDCALKSETQNMVLVNIPNPVFTNLPDIGTPEIENPAVTNGTFSLAPGQTAKITLRFFDPDKTTSPSLCGRWPLPVCAPGDYNPTDNVQPVPVPMPVPFNAILSLPLVITTFPLAPGTIGIPYTAGLATSGGIAPVSWSLASGSSLPPGLTLSAGVISGTPTVAGSFDFTVVATDSSTPTAQAVSKGFSIQVLPATANLIFVVQPSNTLAGQVISPTVQVKLQDNNGSVIPNVTVNMSLGTSACAGCALSGVTSSITGPTGIATFTGLSLDKGGWGYTLLASTGSPSSSVASAAFDVIGFCQSNISSTVRGLHTATLLLNGKVLIAGGQKGTPLLPEVLLLAELYDPASGTIGPTGPLTAARSYHNATLLPNGRVLIVGGSAIGNWPPTDSLSSAEIYDPASGTWSSAGTLTTGRYGHTATLLPNGKVLIAGGWNSSSGFLKSTELYDPTSGSWSPAASMGAARRWHTATLLPNGKVLVAGGGDDFPGGHPLASAELYDPDSGTWNPTGSMTAPRQVHTATLLPNGKVLVVGSFNPGPVYFAELYDPASGTWSQSGPSALGLFGHAATLLPDGKVLVSGGMMAGAGISPAAVLYDATSGAWSGGGFHLQSRYTHTATLLPSGKVFVVGGIDAVSSYLFSAEQFFPERTKVTFTTQLGNATAGIAMPPVQVRVVDKDGNGISGTLVSMGIVPSSCPTCTLSGTTTATTISGGYATFSNLIANKGGWGFKLFASAAAYGVMTASDTFDVAGFCETGSMSVTRFRTTMTLLPNGKVLVAAGEDGSNVLKSAELYDPATGTWSSTGALNVERFSHAAVLLANGMVLVEGGNGTTTGGIQSTAELYNPGPGTWSTTGPLNADRTEHTTTLLPNGKVLVVGGHGNPPAGVLSSAEIYDPTPGTWSYTTGPLHNARYGHTATLLPDGKVLVAGGFNSSGPLLSAEIYDPAAGTWSYTTDSLHAARAFHTATLLPNGRVLIAGGEDGTGSLSSAEIYDPAAGSWSYTTGSLHETRTAHTATLLPNGTVLVAGGKSGAIIRYSAEIYDPGAGIFSSTGSMVNSRLLHSAVLLPNGKTLVAGGSPTVAELFYPMSCATFPSGYVPFTCVYYISGPNSVDDRLLVGTMTMANWVALASLPLPSRTNQRFCGLVVLAPGRFADAYVPTAEERSGVFSSFGALLIDPLTGQPFPYPGIIPMSRIPDPFAWRVRMITP